MREQEALMMAKYGGCTRQESFGLLALAYIGLELALDLW